MCYRLCLKESVRILLGMDTDGQEVLTLYPQHFLWACAPALSCSPTLQGYFTFSISWPVHIEYY